MNGDAGAAVILEGKRSLVTGVSTATRSPTRSPSAAQRQGAEVVLTSFGRVRRMTERAAKRLPEPPDVLELDVNDDEDLAALAAELGERWGRVDGVVHAIAHAPAGRARRRVPRRAARERRRGVRDQRLLAEGARAAPGAADGAERRRARARSIVGLDFDASVAWPAYDWMGVAKAALESVARYLARDLGPRGDPRQPGLGRADRDRRPPRASPGSATSPAPGRDGAPAGLGQRRCRPRSPTRASVPALRPRRAAISGEILHVDGGFHALGAAALGNGAVEPATAGQSKSS